jgi:glucokinase
MNILAIDIGGSQFRTALATVADSGSNAGLHFASTSQRCLSPDCTKDKLLAMLEESIAESASCGSYERIGITIPGLANPATGTWIYACFSGIRNLPIGSILSEKYGGKPVFLDNDVNACALAERQFGICKNTKDFLWITVSNGIGGGLVLNGEIYRGHFGNAGEIGHFNVVEDNGFRCGCGKNGCLEAEAAGPGIARRYAALLNKESSEITAQQSAERARAGDPTAQAVFDITGRLIGKAASYAVNLLNLEKVVLGGGVSRSFDLLLPSMETTFREKVFRDANPNPILEQTGLGLDAGLAGAVALAMNYNGITTSTPARPGWRSQ